MLRVFALPGIARVTPHLADLNEALEHAQAVVPRPLRRRAVPPLAPCAATSFSKIGAPVRVAH